VAHGHVAKFTALHNEESLNNKEFAGRTMIDVAKDTDKFMFANLYRNYR